jgi:hypothetical protein
MIRHRDGNDKFWAHFRHLLAEGCQDENMLIEVARVALCVMFCLLLRFRIERGWKRQKKSFSVYLTLILLSPTLRLIYLRSRLVLRRGSSRRTFCAPLSPCSTPEKRLSFGERNLCFYYPHHGSQRIRKK